MDSVGLSANSLGDFGGQRLAQGFASNSRLTTINLSHTGVSDRTCFVLSRVLAGHPSIKRLDLSW